MLCCPRWEDKQHSTWQLKLKKTGLWKKHGVKMIGVDVDAIELAEDRELFRQHVIKLGMTVAPSRIANSFFGRNGGCPGNWFSTGDKTQLYVGRNRRRICTQKEEFDEALRRGLDASPTHEVLVEKSSTGLEGIWVGTAQGQKRQCNHHLYGRNLDPMGIHTGDSITVAPAMTLSDRAYQEMRIRPSNSCVRWAILEDVMFNLHLTRQRKRIDRSGNQSKRFQDHLHWPKATGYPIAKIAAKLAIGYNLDELNNQITKTTSAFFWTHPWLCDCKDAEVEFRKFHGADPTLGFKWNRWEKWPSEEVFWRPQKRVKALKTTEQD